MIENFDRELQAPRSSRARSAKRLTAALVGAVLLLGVSAGSVSAHPTPEPECSGETYAVVAAEGDAAMAELVVSWQVLDTNCVVEPADAETLISSQQVVVIGGTKAVPSEAVAGLNVIVRLAGADRVATAKAVLAWIDRFLSSPRSATTGLGNAQDERNGFTEKRFTVGTDLEPGVWEFVRHGRNFTVCWHYDTISRQHDKGYVTVNGEPVALRKGNFGLLEGDIVVLRADPDFPCPIKWVRE